jgi:hypothetical protein
LKFYLFYWILGSCVVASGLLLFIGKFVKKKAMLICICTTFLLLLAIETFATNLGIWSWSNNITLCMIGKIPLEEMIIYITSALLTILFFEIIYHLLANRAR